MSPRERSKLFLSNQDSNISSGARASLSMDEKVFSLFQPDILLPVQYFATTRRKSGLEPEKKLMMAVLQDAIACFQNSLLARDKERKTLSSEAEEWIMEENSNWLFSFDMICEVLGFNQRYLREGLMRWKKKALLGGLKAKVYRLTHIGERKKKLVDASKACQIKEHFAGDFFMPTH